MLTATLIIVAALGGFASFILWHELQLERADRVYWQREYARLADIEKMRRHERWKRNGIYTEGQLPREGRF